MIRPSTRACRCTTASPEKIVGILHYKDLLPVWEERRRAIGSGRPSRAFRISRLLRPHLVVPETKPLSQMLEEFREGRSHMAMVVDEFGTIVGMLTVEDVLEQVVGRIEDEHDEKTCAPTRMPTSRNWTAPRASAIWKPSSASRSRPTPASRRWPVSCCSACGEIPTRRRHSGVRGPPLHRARDGPQPHRARAGGKGGGDGIGASCNQ